MRVKAFIRVAKGYSGKAKIAANVRPSDEPLKDSNGYALPTVSFAIQLSIPDSLINRAEQVIAEVTIPEEQAEILAEVAEVAS